MHDSKGFMTDNPLTLSTRMVIVNHKSEANSNLIVNPCC